MNSSQNGFILYQTKQIGCKIDAFSKQQIQGEIKLKGCMCLNSTILDSVKRLQLLIQNMTLATIMTKDSSVFSDCEGILYP